MKNHRWKGHGQGHLTRFRIVHLWNISRTTKAKDFKLCIRVGHAKYWPCDDCPLSGRGHGHVSNLYILDFENFATRSRRCIGVIKKLFEGQLVDYTYDAGARRGWMHKCIILRWLTVTLKLHYFDLFWTSTSCSYTVMQQLARFWLTHRVAWTVCGSTASC